MKNLKDFTEFQQDIESLDSDVLTVSEAAPNFHVGTVKSKQHHQVPMDPPAVLIMRRKSIRQFPDNQRVAMYFVDKINKYVTVPYTAMQWSSTSMPEQTDMMEVLKGVVNEGEEIIEFDDGSEFWLNEQTAQSLLSLLEDLNTTNRKKTIKMMQESKNQFCKVIDFANKNLK